MSTPPAGPGTDTGGSGGGDTGGGGGNLPAPRPSAPAPVPTGGDGGGTATGGSGGGGLPAPRPSNPPATPGPGGQPPASPAPGPAGSSGGRPDPTAEWTPPKDSGVVEVDPEQLWDAAKRMTSLRDEFITKCHGYAQALAGTGNMSGEDYIGIYFAGLYDPLARDAMSALGDLMNSVGGVVEGLIHSANTYAAADHASTPGSGAAPSVPVPSYGPESFARPAPATLHGYQDLESWGDNPVVTALGLPLTDPIGALTAWFPKGHQDLLITAADAWRGIDAEVVALAQGLNSILDGLTVDSSVAKTPRGGRWAGVLTSNQVQAWQQGMRKFCNKIWGAKPWGTKGLPAHPLGLAGTCAEKLATMCDDQRHAIDAARSALERQVAGTVLATVVGALLTEVTFGISDLIAEMIDENEIRAAIMTLVDTYYRPIEQIELTWDLLTLRANLEQALAAAPTIQYMEAQADSIGTRSLHDFGYPGMQGQPPAGGKFSTKQYSGWGDPNGMPTYPVDLAGQEGTGGSHVLDRHVGLTDQQLLDRANGMDMSNPENGSSGFNDVGSAQTLVQGDLNTPENQAKIAAWLNGPRNANAKQDQLTINETLPAGSDGTGRVVVDQNGTHQVVDGNGVRAVLKYNKDLNPPFYVYTAFPTRNAS